jgi:hypothetical protein
MNTVVHCPACGLGHRPDARWCSGCLLSFHGASETRHRSSTETSPDLTPPPQSPDLTRPPQPPDLGKSPPLGTSLRRRRGWTTALLALVVAWAVVGTINDVRDRRRFGAVATAGTADPAGFSFKEVHPATGQPVRFDPCTPVGYVVNSSHAPSGALSDVHAALAKTSQATGIEFVYEGLTDEVPDVDRPPLQPDLYGRRWSPVLVAWTPGDASLFREHGVGVAANSFVANDRGRLVYVTGIIVMNSDQELSNGFGAGRTWGKVILHEAGHLVGLGHVDNPAEVMNPSLVSSPASWGVGDLAGLRRLGSLAGCVDVPDLPR